MQRLRRIFIASWNRFIIDQSKKFVDHHNQPVNRLRKSNLNLLAVGAILWGLAFVHGNNASVVSVAGFSSSCVKSSCFSQPLLVPETATDIAESRSETFALAIHCTLQSWRSIYRNGR